LGEEKKRTSMGRINEPLLMLERTAATGSGALKKSSRKKRYEWEKKTGGNS